MPIVNGTLLDDGGAVVNVMNEDFGAVGDGVTDDADAIHAAVAHATTLGGAHHHVIPRPDRAGLASTPDFAGPRDLLDERRGLDAAAPRMPTSGACHTLSRLRSRTASATGLARPRLDPSALPSLSWTRLTCVRASG